MIDIEAWALLASALIPFATAVSVAPEGTNAYRVAIATILAMVIAGIDCYVDAGSFDLANCLPVFVAALVTSQTAYKMTQGALGERDLNDMVPNVGLGAIELDT